MWVLGGGRVGAGERCEIQKEAGSIHCRGEHGGGWYGQQDGRRAVKGDLQG